MPIATQVYDSEAVDEEATTIWDDLSMQTANQLPPGLPPVGDITLAIRGPQGDNLFVQGYRNPVAGGKDPSLASALKTASQFANAPMFKSAGVWQAKDGSFLVHPLSAGVEVQGQIYPLADLDVDRSRAGDVFTRPEGSTLAAVVGRAMGAVFSSADEAPARPVAELLAGI